MKINQKKLIEDLKKRLDAYKLNPEYHDDRFISITLQEALQAAAEGNFGVGAIIVHKNGKILEKGHNRVFNPYFRSDLHAEMDVMTKFEEHNPDIENLHDLILYTSLEPCPMCFSRLITSGIEKILYAACDEEGGMVTRRESLPPVWKVLAARQKFEKADCSQELSDLALEIFLATAKENHQKLMQR